MSSSIVSRKKLKIIKRDIGYSPRSKIEPCYNLLNESTPSSGNTVLNYKLYIKDLARQTIFEHIGWGKKTKNNIVEQGGLLLGHVYYDEEQDLTYGVVETTIAGLSGEGTSVHLKLSLETWDEMLTEKDAINELWQGEDLQIIGWYHTHPNTLDVFMSGTDRNTQSSHFNKDWHFAIVMNPHRLIWRAFCGRKATPCRGYFINAIEKTDANNSNDTGSAINKNISSITKQVESDFKQYHSESSASQAFTTKKYSINKELVWLLLVVIGFTLGYSIDKIF